VDDKIEVIIFNAVTTCSSLACSREKTVYEIELGFWTDNILRCEVPLSIK
jgi:hypothetical protein